MNEALQRYKEWLRSEIRVFQAITKDKRHNEAYRQRALQSLSTLLRCEEILESFMTDDDYEAFKQRKK